MWFSRFCLSILLRYTIRLYQNRQIWHMDSPRYLAQQWKLGQRVKGQGQRVTKCITSYPQPCLFKAIEWSASVMHSIECSASGFNRAFHILLTLVVWMTYEMHTRSHSRRIVPRKPQKNPCHFVFDYNSDGFSWSIFILLYQWKQEWILYKTVNKMYKFIRNSVSTLIGKT